MPPLAVSSAGVEAIELAASAGLYLDDWQQWCLEGMLGERADGKWAAFECALIVPRQNGKNSILEALELAALVLFGERLVVHSAHKFDSAQEHFLRMQQLVETCDDLRRKVAKIPTANGKEAIVLKSGARLKFVARSRGSARGFSGDRIVFDEAFLLPQEAIGSMMPALSARPNPQVVYSSSAPHADSAVLHGIRKRALADDPGRLWFAEWGNDPGTSYDDRDAWASANPALGIRITEEFIENELKAMRDLGDEFARERLGVPSDEDASADVFGPGKWVGCYDPNSRRIGDVAIALDVDDDLGWATFSAAGFREDGLVHVEIIERKPGTSWVVAAAKAYSEKHETGIWLDPRSPAASVLPELVTEEVRINELPPGAFPRACSQFQRSVVEGTLRHLSQAPLEAAVSGCAIRESGDNWVWARKTSTIDISPLISVTLALYGLIKPNEDFAFAMVI